ncbi:MAG: 1-acyl-sn-glycerol-3-phosphate acyltransferase [Chloroflexi bacterium]|jgi:1-acyl-sn-glycerol-3-phosphate acyltransferase|nr:1-acyl-sn-glycerol-3-phosphate acyltransferase [Chloroflexota bacterium]
MKTPLIWLVNSIIRSILFLIMRIDDKALRNVPWHGPLILVSNHVNFLDVPVIFTHLISRPVTGFVKRETWDNPVMGFLFTLWGGIPIDRGVADFDAFKAAKHALLDEHKILAVAPEGTRSEDGRLLRGKPGITILASRTGVPILPIACFGHENFKHNFRRLKRTPITIRVGEPFRCKFDSREKNKAVLLAMTDAIMLEIADLLPEEYHGEYAGVDINREMYLEYLDSPSREEISQALGKQFSHA